MALGQDDPTTLNEAIAHLKDHIQRFPDIGVRKVKISARLYEDIKAYLVRQSDDTAGHLLNRLWETNDA
jgi:hypothetical protein